MGYPQLAYEGMKPIFDSMMSQKLLKKNIFAFYFTTKQADHMGFKPDLTIGYYDTAKFDG